MEEREIEMREKVNKELEERESGLINILKIILEIIKLHDI